MIVGYVYLSSSDSFNVINIEIDQINLFFEYIFYIRTYVENILNLAHAGREAMIAERRESNGRNNYQTNKTTIRNKEIIRSR